ncbi:MAG: peptidylprolyl isomerase, partial [Rhizobiales bacterium]|nr:peptidylprolyl isomerase [Hyphomicrobiales bacterium]
RARSELNNLRDKIEDERAGGSTLAETAKKLGLKSLTIEAIDRSGRAPEGKLVADLPKTPDVISAAFASDVGVDSEALQLPNNGLLWYDVTGITPSRERTLEEVKDQVATRWRDDEIATRLLGKVEDMLGKLKAGGTLAQLASEAGLKLVHASDLQRGRPAGFVPAKVVDAVFKVAKDAIGSSEGETQTQRIVFRVTEVIDPPLDANSSQAKQLAASLQTSYSDDMIGQYIARLESDYGVSINQAAVNQVIGGTTNP